MGRYPLNCARDRGRAQRICPDDFETERRSRTRSSGVVRSVSIHSTSTKGQDQGWCQSQHAVGETHIGFDWPTRPRVVRRRRGDDFFQNFECALEPARTGEVDVVVHGCDLLYRSRVPAWLAETAFAPLKRLASSGVPVLLVPGNHERGRMPYPLLARARAPACVPPATQHVLEAHGLRVAFIGFPYTHDIRRRFPRVLAEASSDDSAADIPVLCFHHCIEGASCGPGNFTFRFGADVIRTADLPKTWRSR